MNIDDIKIRIAKNKNRVLELKKTTGELIKGMQTLCAFLTQTMVGCSSESPKSLCVGKPDIRQSSLMKIWMRIA